MPAEGLEPTRSCDHWILSPARLPIPPRRRKQLEATKLPSDLKRSDEIERLQTSWRSENFAKNDCVAEARPVSRETWQYHKWYVL